jgi:hypothetical protein
LPFKCNLQRYNVDATLAIETLQSPRTLPLGSEAEAPPSPNSKARHWAPAPAVNASTILPHHRKTLPGAHAAREAALLAAQFQDPKQAGVACVTLRLAPRTRIASTVGTLNHLRVPSGCLFHFVGNSGSFLPPGGALHVESS